MEKNDLLSEIENIEKDNVVGVKTNDPFKLKTDNLQTMLGITIFVILCIVGGMFLSFWVSNISFVGGFGFVENISLFRSYSNWDRVENAWFWREIARTASWWTSWQNVGYESYMQDASTIISLRNAIVATTSLTLASLLPTVVLISVELGTKKETITKKIAGKIPVAIIMGSLIALFGFVTIILIIVTNFQIQGLEVLGASWSQAQQQMLPRRANVSSNLGFGAYLYIIAILGAVAATILPSIKFKKGKEGLFEKVIDQEKSDI